MKILVSDKLAEPGVKLLKEFGEVDVKTGLAPEELKAIIGNYDALVVRSETKVTKEIIEATTKMQVIGRAGVGVDNIDIEAASKKGIVVVNAPMANSIAAVEHTVALMLSLARNVPQADASLRAGEWAKSKYTGVEIRNKVLGVIGLGRIGGEVARRAQGLMMRVIAFDPFASAEKAAKLGITMVSLEELLKTSDFITLHTPLVAGTKGLIGAKELAMMKSSARIINCARGGLIDEDALFEALEAGTIAGAALDVFVQEPLKDSKLLSCSKVVMTPHLGASTTEAQFDVAIDIADQVLSVLKGESSPYAINAPVFSPETMTALGAYLPVGEKIGALFAQMHEGQLGALEVVYNGDLAQYDTAPLTAAIVKGLLQTVSEEMVTLMNANLVAKSRGLAISEKKSAEEFENFANTITLRAAGAGSKEVVGTLVYGVPHIVRLNNYRMDVIPGDSYMLIAEHIDKPGVIGKVGTLLGKADINIAFMQVGRVDPRGQALMVLGVDDPIPANVVKDIQAVENVGTVKVVKL
jgi:D-3-phosphoglycerate dehydrogenase